MLNPILKAEWLKEGRGIRLPMMIIFYNAILALVTIIFMFFNAESFQEGYYYDTSSYLYQFLIISSLQIVAVFLMMPFSVSGLYASDEDKHMQEQFSMIPGVSVQFIFAKIFVILSIQGLLFLSALPVISLSCIYSGVSWGKVLRLGLMIFMYSFWSGSIAIFFYSVCKRAIWAFSGTIFTQILFVIGTIIAAAILRNCGLSVAGAKEIPAAVSNACMILFLLNPLSSYMGYYGNITGDVGLITSFISHFGMDASEKIFSFLYYKAASVLCILTGVLFLVLAVWFSEKNRKN